MSSAYQLPDRIEIACTLHGKPACEILVRVTTRVNRKNNFNAVIGPTDTRGKVSCSKEDILKQADQSRDLFLMDYADPIENFSGEIEVSPMSRHDIKKAIDAYELFSEDAGYPKSWKETLQSADRVLASLDPKSRIDISAQCSDTTIKLVEVPCIVGDRKVPGTQ